MNIKINHTLKELEFIQDNRNDKDLSSEIYYYILNEVLK